MGIFLIILALAIFVGGGWWHKRENQNMALQWQSVLGDENTTQLMRFASSRTIQFLAAVGSCLIILIVYSWQLSDADKELDKLNKKITKLEQEQAEATPQQAPEESKNPLARNRMPQAATRQQRPMAPGQNPYPQNQNFRAMPQKYGAPPQRQPAAQQPPAQQPVAQAQAPAAQPAAQPQAASAPDSYYPPLVGSATPPAAIPNAAPAPPAPAGQLAPAPITPPVAAPSPAPVAPAAMAAPPAAPVKPAATIDDVYNPEKQNNSNEAAMDGIKKRYESILVLYNFMKQCGKAGPNDYPVILSSLGQEMASVNAPGRLQYDVITSAEGSYKELYSKSSCNGADMSSLVAQYTNYITALSNNVAAVH
jgi:hypothetical protein